MERKAGKEFFGSGPISLLIDGSVEKKEEVESEKFEDVSLSCWLNDGI